MSIDWSKAPDGCIGAFARIVGNQRKAFFVFSKRPSGYMSREGYEGEGEDGSYHVFSEFWEWLDKPWNGQGLPPVGTVCEHYGTADDLAWLEVEVIGHGNVDGRNVAFFRYGTGSPRFTVSYSTANNFRPIRTHEQIAAEERDAGISDMQTITDGAGPTVYAKLSALYDAGYRRQEEGK
ncbi:TPA: hypothetical protein L4H08_005488 [Pseudomonas aeruginosa]|nr:hypothetical protein [Pseudomonas aeruginosa]